MSFTPKLVGNLLMKMSKFYINVHLISDDVICGLSSPNRVIFNKSWKSIHRTRSFIAGSAKHQCKSWVDP
jgi:hypothetical protein